MKMFRKIASLVLAFCLCLGVYTPVAAEKEMSLNGMLVVLYTANVRGDISVYPKVAALKADYAARGAEVVLADLGNFLHGTRYATYDSGKTVVSLMDAAGYDVAALGAYEFAFGTGQVTSRHGTVYEDGSLGQFLADASFEVVSANVLAGAESAYAPHAAASDWQVGFFGLTDPNAPAMLAESSVKGLRFRNDMETIQREQNAALRTAGHSLVICLSNAGDIGDMGHVQDVLRLTSETDGDMKVGAIITNGSTQLGVYHETLSLDGVVPDATVQAAVDAAMAEIDAVYPDEAVAVSKVRLSGAIRDVRAGESNLGNLWTDALRWFALEGGIEAFYDEDDIANGNTGITVDDDHVIAMWNGGNLRDSIQPGEVTMKDLSRVLPYPNTVAVVYLTGTQLLEHLEATSQGLPFASASASASSSFMHASGIKYHVAASMAYDAGPLYRTNWFTAQSVNRVTIESINGKVFDAAATYAVITSNANYNGMDASYVCLEKGEDSAITSAAVTDVVWRYIREELGGTIGVAYAAAEGRIMVDTAYTDIAKDSPYQAAVQFVTENGIMKGVSGGMFAPEASLTRAELIVALYKLAGSPVVESTDELTARFTDVPEDVWYTNAVAWALEKKITSGTSATTFSPNAMVTRQEMAVLVYNFAGRPAVDVAVPLSDTDAIAPWARDAVAHCYENGYLEILNGAAFAPKTSVTRGLAAVVLAQVAAK